MAKRQMPALQLLLAFLAAVLGGCGAKAGGAGPAGGARLKLAVVPKGTAHDFWQSVHAGAKAAAERLDVDIVWKGPQPEGDRAAQIALVETLTAGQVQGLLLAPVDSRALAAPIAECKHAGVPTVVFDSDLEGTAHVGFVATDNRRGGELAGETLGALLGGKGNVIMLRFQEGSASTAAREAGFLAVMKARFPGVVIVSDNQFAGDVGKARTKSDELLVAHADIDGVFCPNESTAHGMLQALEAAGKAGTVRFVGFDAAPKLVEGLQRRHIDALVVQDPVGMGRRGVELLVAHLRGDAIPAVERTQLVVATPQNCSEPAVKALLAPDLSILNR